MLNWIKTSQCPLARAIRLIGEDYEEWKRDQRKYRQD